MKNITYLFFTAIIFNCFVLGQSVIEGNVSSESGEALVGANVTIDGTAYGAATGPGGNYEINIPSGDISGASVILTASYIGYQSTSQSVNVPASGSVTQNFSLAVDAIGMKAISVTALGFTANRDEQGSSSVSVAAEDMTFVETEYMSYGNQMPYN